MINDCKIKIMPVVFISCILKKNFSDLILVANLYEYDTKRKTSKG